MQGAAKGKLEFRDPKSGKTYKLGDKPATLKASASVVVQTLPERRRKHHQETSWSPQPFTALGSTIIHVSNSLIRFSHDCVHLL